MGNHFPGERGKCKFVSVEEPVFLLMGGLAAALVWLLLAGNGDGESVPLGSIAEQDRTEL